MLKTRRGDDFDDINPSTNLDDIPLQSSYIRFHIAKLGYLKYGW